MTFGRRLVLDRISVDVAPGDVLGLVGPNGAGKTTLLRIAAGLVRPTGGAAFTDGFRAHARPWWSTVGLVIEEPAMEPRLTGQQWVERVLGATGSYSRAHARGVAAAALDQVGLADARRRPTATYSQGMRQRLGLAAALSYRPRTVLLDEPTNGMDPEGFALIRGVTRELADGGCTVVVSSHILHELETTANRLAVVHEGRLRYFGPLSSFATRTSIVRVGVAPDEAGRALAILGKAFGKVSSGEEGILVEGGEGRAVNAALVAEGIVAAEIAPVEDSLEDRYLRWQVVLEGRVPEPAGGAAGATRSGDGGPARRVVQQP